MKRPFYFPIIVISIEMPFDYVTVNAFKIVPGKVLTHFRC